MCYLKVAIWGARKRVLILHQISEKAGNAQRIAKKTFEFLSPCALSPSVRTEKRGVWAPRRQDSGGVCVQTPIVQQPSKAIRETEKAQRQTRRGGAQAHRGLSYLQGFGHNKRALVSFAGCSSC